MSEEIKSTGSIDPLLLELLCCPSCKGDSELNMSQDTSSMSCNLCSRVFAVELVPGPQNEGILIPKLLLADEGC